MKAPTERHMTAALFNGCNRKERAALKHLGTTLDIGPGRRLATEGMTGQQFAIVLNGELAVSRDDKVVAMLKAGDCVGEIALLSGRHVPASATVESTTQAAIWVLSTGEFDQLCELAPHVCQKLNRIGLQRAAQNSA